MSSSIPNWELGFFIGVGEMNIYLLEVKEESYSGFENYDGHVVQAKTEKKARELCPYSEEGDIWVMPVRTAIRLIGINRDQEEKVILSSFNAK